MASLSDLKIRSILSLKVPLVGVTVMNPLRLCMVCRSCINGSAWRRTLTELDHCLTIDLGLPTEFNLHVELLEKEHLHV